MRNDTRLAYNAYLGQIATLNGVGDATVSFSVAPVVEQKLEEIIQKSSDFLSKISIVTVKQQEGAKVGLGVTRPIASRTLTNSVTGVRRKPVDPTDTADKGRYFCAQTNSDVGIKYAKLDMWAHRPEFQTLIRDTIVKQQGRDRIMIGWNGVSRADTTDITANPLLQDVNLGWLYKIRTFAPDRVLSDGALTPDATKAIYVAVGTPGGDVDYVNLDALVFDATELLDEWHRDDTDLVVIVGRDLLQDKYANIINAAGDKPTEMEARNRILTLPKQIGGKTAVVVPFFPATSLLITSLDNLAIYVQAESRRRQIKDAPEFDEIQDFQSVNEAYVVEDYGRCALVENIQMKKKP
ncbi:phage major capsid protein, P2 family [Sphingomonas sp.]|uniref:phage major capsid protein, P2 family n=1 Tax=Sphingomonas sp. TaxID=28214 RepID=UPI000DBBDE64|nr:phage major capsid protein, P2 family [Sphingomonas sp.]PZT91676.1 MAG: phage major capsid protein, P2 family [Sphingomonas sp.]